MLIFLKYFLSIFLHFGVSLCVLYLIFMWKAGIHCQYVALILRNSFYSLLLFILHSNYGVTSSIMMIFVAVYVFIFRLQYTSVMLRFLISSVTAADAWVRQTYFSLRLPGLSVRIKGWWWRVYSWCISDQGYRADGHAHQRTQGVFCLKAGLLRPGWSILMPICSAIFFELIKHSYPARRHRTGPRLKWSTEVPDVIYNYNLCIPGFYFGVFCMRKASRL